MFKAYLKNLLLALAFVIGILMPEAARAAWLIQYLIIAMLLLAFMRMDAPWRKPVSYTHLTLPTICSV